MKEPGPNESSHVAEPTIHLQRGQAGVKSMTQEGAAPYKGKGLPRPLDCGRHCRVPPFQGTIHCPGLLLWLDAFGGFWSPPLRCGFIHMAPPHQSCPLVVHIQMALDSPQDTCFFQISKLVMPTLEFESPPPILKMQGHKPLLSLLPKQLVVFTCQSCDPLGMSVGWHSETLPMRSRRRGLLSGGTRLMLPLHHLERKHSLKFDVSDAFLTPS
jgi:hypothetical protein